MWSSGKNCSLNSNPPTVLFNELKCPLMWAYKETKRLIPLLRMDASTVCFSSNRWPHKRAAYS